MIYKSSKELYSRFLFDILQDLPMSVIISTYGLWCGVNGKGITTASGCTTYRLLDYLNRNSDRCTTAIIVGHNGSIPQVVIETAKRFKNIGFVVVDDFHSKCIATSTGILSIGSSNLTDSDWFELNTYNAVDVDNKDYLTICDHLERVCSNRGNRIDPSEEYQSVNIDDIVRGG
jgi:hypothetical protein